MSTTTADKPSILLTIISFLIPLVGLILWIVQRSTKPVSAKRYGLAALIGFALAIVLNFVVGGMIMASM